MSEVLSDDNPQTISLASLTSESSAGSGDDAAIAGNSATTASAEDLLRSSTSSSRRGPAAGVLLLLLVLVVAGGALLLMRRFGTRGHIQFLDFDLDVPQEIVVRGAYETVMTNIKSTTLENQIPLQGVKKNPFYFYGRAEQPTTAQADSDMGLHERERLAREQERLAAMKQAAAEMQLQSVMGGRRPLALIDGELRQVGDRLGKFFTVTSIDNRGVQLQTDNGETYHLALGSGD